jgi:hypothetical protein
VAREVVALGIPSMGEGTEA